MSFTFNDMMGWGEDAAVSEKEERKEKPNKEKEELPLPIYQDYVDLLEAAANLLNHIERNGKIRKTAFPTTEIMETLRERVEFGEYITGTNKLENSNVDGG